MRKSCGTLIGLKRETALAYFNLIAAVPETEVKRFRADPTKLMRPSLVLGASHLLASWVTVQPLARLLWQTLDGGEVIHADLCHPLRPPLFQPLSNEWELAQQTDAAWQAALGGEPPLDDD
jgi:hypothetical protein